MVWHHSTPRPLEGILGRGPLGVDLFFAISGFLITTLMIREQSRTGRLAVGRFYARRSLRIFPLYYVVLSLYVVRAMLFLPEGPARAHFLHSLPFYATYTSNWFVDFAVPFPVIFSFAWSLATEEQFYAFWPWIMARAQTFHLPVVVASLLLVVTQGVQWGLLTSVLAPDSLARRIAGSISSPLCMGILLAWALHERRSFVLLYRWLGHRWSAPLILGALARSRLHPARSALGHSIGDDPSRRGLLHAACTRPRFVDQRRAGPLDRKSELRHLPPSRDCGDRGEARAASRLWIGALRFHVRVRGQRGRRERFLCLVRASFLALARFISTSQRTVRIGDPV